MSIHNDEPLAVSPRRAAYLLDCGITRIYELINSSELESFKDGAARKITMRSIRDRVERQVQRSAQTAA